MYSSLYWFRPQFQGIRDGFTQRTLALWLSSLGVKLPRATQPLNEGFLYCRIGVVTAKLL
jgi:hypothetical protein